MIECMLGSLIGTLLGLAGSALIVQYQENKNEKKKISELKKLIDNLTTFKIKFEDEI